MLIPSQFLEAVNGSLLVMLIAMAMIFVIYTGRQVALFGLSRTAYEWSKPAIAMLIFIVGDMLIRAPVWYLRHLENHGHATNTSNGIAMAVIAAGAVTSIIGGICIIRNFAPYRMGIWPPLIAAAAALLFGIGMAQ